MKSRFALFLTLISVSNAAHAQDIYRTHRNARFGTLVRYPANLVAPQVESENGDGRKFLSRDGQIELTTYAFRNLRNRSARTEMNRAVADWKRDGARLTYFKSGVSWFVLSGYVGNDIFYEKTLLQNDVFHTLIWQYPQTAKKRLDASVSRSAAAFSVGKSRESASPALAPRPQTTSKPRVLPPPRPRALPRATSGY